MGRGAAGRAVYSLLRSCVGDKMWTSAAFHDVTPNTAHMLLARIAGPDTPPGARGSAFLDTS